MYTEATHEAALQNIYVHISLGGDSYPIFIIPGLHLDNRQSLGRANTLDSSDSYEKLTTDEYLCYSLLPLRLQRAEVRKDKHLSQSVFGLFRLHYKHLQHVWI